MNVFCVKEEGNYLVHLLFAIAWEYPKVKDNVDQFHSLSLDVAISRGALACSKTFPGMFIFSPVFYIFLIWRVLAIKDK